MSEANFTKEWANDAILTEANLDNFKSSIETYVNSQQIDADNIQNGGIETASISDAAITAAKIGAGAVTSSILAGSESVSITEAKFASRAVTKQKQVNQAASSDGSDPGLDGISVSAPKNGSVSGTGLISGTAASITTHGRPVSIQVTGKTTSPAGSYFVRIYRDGSDLSGVGITDTLTLNENGLHYLDLDVAGSASTYEYQLHGSGAGSLNFDNVQVIVREV